MGQLRRIRPQRRWLRRHALRDLGPRRPNLARDADGQILPQLAGTRIARLSRAACAFCPADPHTARSRTGVAARRDDTPDSATDGTTLGISARVAKVPGAAEKGRRKTEAAKRSAFARRLRRTPWPSAVPLRRARLGLPVRAHFRPGSGRPRVGTRPGGGPRSDFSRVRTSTGPLDTGALVRLPLERPVRRSLRLTVARSHGDLELNDLIPLLVASIALGDGKKFSEPATRILGR